MLILILDKLDARTTTTTTILSKRWLDLPRRSHTSYDISVHELLPPRYHRLKQAMTELKAGYEAEKNSHHLTDYVAVRERYERWMKRVDLLSPILRRYERRAMLCYVKRVNAFLLGGAPKRGSRIVQRCYVKRVNAFLLGAPKKHRPVQKLRLQSLKTSRTNIDQWVAAAIAGCGVEERELDFGDFGCPYDFRLLDGLQDLRLKRLVLSSWFHHLAPGSSVFQGLTQLTLYRMSDLRSVCDVVANCVRLVDLRLRHSCVDDACFRIDAPASKLKKLQLDRCKIRKIYLHSLPCLETFAFRGEPAKLYYVEVPRLRRVSLNFLQEIGDDNGSKDGSSSSSSSSMTYPLSKFLKGWIPPLEYLVLQLKGSQVWIEPIAFPGLLGHLRKLFVANVPTSWDVFWIFSLLDAAPALESLHLHIDKSSSAEETSAVVLDVEMEHREYHRLKELVVVGFDGAGWQTGFVKRIMRDAEARPSARRASRRRRRRAW
ncbi:hypothetical protein BRADI_3g60440v3 [Brachypodium distachyon]|nr:hypothetical protein BRADI_3g60440v3 [Brachypodium distachyon]